METWHSSEADLIIRLICKVISSGGKKRKNPNNNFYNVVRKKKIDLFSITLYFYYVYVVNEY